MPSLSIPALRCGGPTHLPHSTVLRAGPLTLLLEQGELRRIRLGNREIIRRIYVGLRGPDWRTIPGLLSELKVEAAADSFQAWYTLTHKQAEYDFIWKVAISGTPDGGLRFQADGKAGSDFATNRAAICLLHPLRECVGGPARYTGSDGQVRTGRFPETIKPDQPFLDFQAFAHEAAPGLWASLKYEGDTFEMEDQRNWSDGSFKTYCPPQARPKPMKVVAGWETRQSVTLELQGRLPVAEVPPERVSLRPAAGAGKPLPDLGFGTASHGRVPGPADSARLKALAPCHLRATFRLSHPSYVEDLGRAVAEANALGLPLEAALIVPEGGHEGDEALAGFARLWKESGAVAVRWLVFSESKDAASGEMLDAARRHLADSPVGTEAGFVVGSKSDFVLLNRNRPEIGSATPPDLGLAYAMTPQVHLFDNRTMAESLQGQEWTLRTAAALWPGRKISITPITIKRAPLVTALKSPPGFQASGSLPPDHWKSQVDTRQFSLFGAGWTLGSLKRLALNGPDAGLTATFYETTGLLGLLAGESADAEALAVPGSDLRMESGWVYPLYHIFADFAEFRGGVAVDVDSDAPLRFDGVQLKLGNRSAILIANLEETPGKLRLDGIGKIHGLRRLNEKNGMLAMSDPAGYRAQSSESLGTQEGSFELEMLPFEVIRIDLS